MKYSKSLYRLVKTAVVLEFERESESTYIAGWREPRSTAARLMDRAWAARVRLGRRLGAGPDDPDVLDLVEANEKLEELLACKMFDYGRVVAQAER